MNEYLLYGVGIGVGLLIGYVVTAKKIADLEAFGDECGEIILKQKRRIDEFTLDVEA